MARIQSRMSISMNGELYWRLKTRCTEVGVPMSHVVESLVTEHLKDQPLPTRPKPCCLASLTPPGHHSIPCQRKRDKRDKTVTEKAKEAIEVQDRTMEDPKVVAAKNHIINGGRVIKSPCRKERCGIEQLHERHD